MMRLRQHILLPEVERDIRQRNTLWEQEDFQESYSPSKISWICGVLKLLKVSCIPLTHPTKLHLKALPSFCIALLSANRFYFNLKRKENEFFTTSLYEIDRILNDCYLAEQPNNPDNAELIRE
jgi:hypothetical protein